LLELLVSPELRAAEPRLATLDRLRWRLGRLAAKPLVHVNAAGELAHTGPLAGGLLALLRRFG
jgi:hypothetical protein